jgi:hypothetical protein
MWSLAICEALGIEASQTATTVEGLYIRLPQFPASWEDPGSARCLPPRNTKRGVQITGQERGSQHSCTIKIKYAAPEAFITGIGCVIKVGIGWLSHPFTAADQTGALSRLLARSCLPGCRDRFGGGIYLIFGAPTICELKKNLISSLMQRIAVKALNRIASQMTNFAAVTSPPFAPDLCTGQAIEQLGVQSRTFLLGRAIARPKISQLKNF